MQGVVGRLHCDSLVVQVTNADGTGVGRVGVNWVILSGHGELWGRGGSPTNGDFPRGARTESDGKAWAYFGPTAPGTTMVGVTGDGLEGQDVTFTIEAAAPSTPAEPAIYGGRHSRYVLRGDGTFAYEVAGVGAYATSGAYATGCGGISLTFADPEWKAKGTLNGDRMTLWYNAAAALDILNEDYLLIPGGPCA